MSPLNKMNFVDKNNDTDSKNLNIRLIEVWILGVIILISIGGIIVLNCLGKEIPSVLNTVGSFGVGYLLSYLK